jgi:cation transport regulator ChaC
MPHTTIRLAKGEVGLFGYGSLLLQSSMEQTLGRPYTAERYQCRLRGWRRRWNILYPNRTYYFDEPDGGRCYPENIVYLNIERADGILNGLVYIISESELPGYDQREWVYDRVDATTDLVGCEIQGGPIWGYVGKREHVLPSPMPVGHAAIRASYIHIVEQGLSELGAAFRDEYLASTETPPAANIIDDRRA